MMNPYWSAYDLYLLRACIHGISYSSTEVDSHKDWWVGSQFVGDLDEHLGTSGVCAKVVDLGQRSTRNEAAHRREHCENTGDRNLTILTN